MNRTCISALILLLSLAGLKGSASVGVLVEADRTIPSGESLVVTLPGEEMSWVEVRAGSEGKVRRTGAGEKVTPGWQLQFLDADSTIILAVELHPTADTDLYHTSSSTAEISVKTYEGADSSYISYTTYKSDVSYEEQTATLADIKEFTTIALTRIDAATYEVWAGNRELQFAAQVSLAEVPAAVRIASDDLAVKRDLLVQSVNIATDSRFIMPDNTGLTLRDVEERGMAGDNREGVYDYLDSDTYTEKALPGGEYTLGVIADGEGGFRLVYLAGARSNASAWTEGMVKGHLRATRFENHYNLEWTDSNGRTDLRECWGRFDGALLELHFPLEKAVIRFSRR